jgi:hypothetical protein
MTGVLAVLAASRKLGSITVSADWGSTLPGAAGNFISGPTRTLTVPAGNPGKISFAVVSDGPASYSKNGGSFASLTDGAEITFADGDTLQFGYTAPDLTSSTCSIAATDATTGASVGSASMSAIYVIPP